MTTTTTMSKKFASSNALNSFLNDPLSAKLYKALYIDWTKNTVRLEGRPMPPL